MVTSTGLGLGACGTTSASASGSACHASSRVVCISQSDDVRSVNVELGETIEVTLRDTSLVWSDLRQVGPQLLQVTHRATSNAHQFRASFQPIKVGATTLQATAAPRCNPGQACPEFMMVWQVRIVVER
jgi:hypothetical protein